MENKIFNKLFELIVSIQILCMLVFLLKEYNHLDKIRFNYKLTETVIIDFTVNFYMILTVIAIIFTIVIISSINILGSGIGDSGSRTIIRFISFIIVYVVLQIGTSFYFQALGSIFIGIWTVISAFIYVMYISNTNTEIPI